ncbi:hypothetical protein MUK42_22958, partial [Musa troglodytarum]
LKAALPRSSSLFGPSLNRWSSCVQIGGNPVSIALVLPSVYPSASASSCSDGTDTRHEPGSDPVVPDALRAVSPHWSPRHCILLHLRSYFIHQEPQPVEGGRECCHGIHFLGFWISIPAPCYWCLCLILGFIYIYPRNLLFTSTFGQVQHDLVACI